MQLANPVFIENLSSITKKILDYRSSLGNLYHGKAESDRLINDRLSSFKGKETPGVGRYDSKTKVI